MAQLHSTEPNPPCVTPHYLQPNKKIYSISKYTQSSAKRLELSNDLLLHQLSSLEPFGDRLADQGDRQVDYGEAGSGVGKGDSDVRSSGGRGCSVRVQGDRGRRSHGVGSISGGWSPEGHGRRCIVESRGLRSWGCRGLRRGLDGWSRDSRGKVRSRIRHRNSVRYRSRDLRCNRGGCSNIRGGGVGRRPRGGWGVLLRRHLLSAFLVLPLAMPALAGRPPPLQLPLAIGVLPRIHSAVWRGRGCLLRQINDGVAHGWPRVARSLCDVHLVPRQCPLGLEPRLPDLRPLFPDDDSTIYYLATPLEVSRVGVAVRLLTRPLSVGGLAMERQAFLPGKRLLTSLLSAAEGPQSPVALLNVAIPVGRRRECLPAFPTPCGLAVQQLFLGHGLERKKNSMLSSPPRFIVLAPAQQPRSPFCTIL